MERAGELVTFLVMSIVSNPDGVTIEAHEDAGAFVIDISADQEDVGKLIGRGGRTIKSMRTLARAVAGQSGCRINVES